MRRRRTHGQPQGHHEQIRLLPLAGNHAPPVPAGSFHIRLQRGQQCHAQLRPVRSALPLGRTSVAQQCRPRTNPRADRPDLRGPRRFPRRSCCRTDRRLRAWLRQGFLPLAGFGITISAGAGLTRGLPSRPVTRPESSRCRRPDTAGAPADCGSMSNERSRLHLDRGERRRRRTLCSARQLPGPARQFVTDRQSRGSSSCIAARWLRSSSSWPRRSHQGSANTNSSSQCATA
jgi:hypothetical protein